MKFPSHQELLLYQKLALPSNLSLKLLVCVCACVYIYIYIYTYFVCIASSCPSKSPSLVLLRL